MGFWSWLIGVEDEPQTRDEPTPEITPPVSDVLLQALLNNEVITREKALTLPAVSGAVDFISNTIASMPVKLYKYKQGKVENLEDDTRVKLLNGDTGDTLDAFQMKKAMVIDYLLGKGGYCYIERNRNEVVALRYVEDIYITVLKNFKPIFKDYVILVEGQQYKPYDFVKLIIHEMIEFNKLFTLSSSPPCGNILKKILIKCGNCGINDCFNSAA